MGTKEKILQTLCSLNPYTVREAIAVEIPPLKPLVEQMRTLS